MRAVVHVALIVGVLATPRATWAAPPAPADLAALLSDYESAPDPTALVTGGDTTATALFHLYRAENQPTFVRVRALRMIGFFPAGVAMPLLQQALRDAAARPVFVREAIGAFVRVAGALAMPELTSLLQRADASVRRAAIEGLAHVNTPSARALLSAHRTQEHDPSVRAVLDAVLGVDRTP